METNRETKFRKVPSLDYLFEISEDGRILRNIKSKKQQRQYLDKDGYYYVTIIKKHTRKQPKIHQLVAECFLGPRPDNCEIDHIDRNKINNHYGNLRYVSHKENCINRDMSNVGYIGNKVYVNEKEFDSFTAAARYISTQTGTPVNTLRHYFKCRRKYISGFNIRYLF